VLFFHIYYSFHLVGKIRGIIPQSAVLLFQSSGILSIEPQYSGLIMSENKIARHDVYGPKVPLI
jgi:hypothetical protein